MTNLPRALHQMGDTSTPLHLHPSQPPHANAKTTMSTNDSALGVGPLSEIKPFDEYIEHFMGLEEDERNRETAENIWVLKFDVRRLIEDQLPNIDRKIDGLANVQRAMHDDQLAMHDDLRALTIDAEKKNDNINGLRDELKALAGSVGALAVQLRALVGLVVDQSSMNTALPYSIPLLITSFPRIGF